MTVTDVARACERDPEERTDMEEIEAAIELLREDGLVEREPAGRYERVDEAASTNAHLVRPTRAAVRAQELSF
jgi:hypothetical protein